MDVGQEKALVERLIAMDAGAWEMFCAAYSRSLLAFVQLSLGYGAEQAEDIVQSTFVRCVRSIRTVDLSRGRLLTWLKAIARNEARTFARRDLRASVSVAPRPVTPELAAGMLGLLDGGHLPEDMLIRQDLRDAIRSVLTGLSARHREVLVAKYVNDMTVAEIAAETELSAKAVESVLSRAREAFREGVRRSAPELTGASEPHERP